MDVRISDIATLQSRVHVSVIPQTLPQTCCVSCYNCAPCHLLSVLLLQEAFSDFPKLGLDVPCLPHPVRPHRSIYTL